MNDSDIIKQVINGDIDKFELLIEKYKHKVFAVIAGRIPIQEHGVVAQDVFLKAFRSLDKFSINRPFENWLVTITVRCCCDYWRKYGRKQQLNVNPPAEKYSEWFNMVEAANALAEFNNNVERQARIDLLENVMRELDQESRLLIELIYFEDWPLQRVADALQWTLSKVKVRSMRVRKKMRQYIAEILNGKEDDRKN